jgi:predicted RNA binding protein YcfA (HicA-like mRNA interferase family)
VTGPLNYGQHLTSDIIVSRYYDVPRKIRQLIADLERADFSHTCTSGSHRKYRHATGITVILSGQSGADAHHHQEKDVRRAIAATTEKKP